MSGRVVSNAVALAPCEHISGAVERVTYHNIENGFCVLRVKVRGQRDPVTVTGHAAAIAAGEYIEVVGHWLNDRNHGLQFKAERIEATVPTTLKGLEKYLGSGMIKGIGPVYAKKLVDAFGQDVFEVIEREPLRLREITGIGPVREAKIIKGWRASSRPMARMRSPRSVPIPTAWRATLPASASRPPTRLRRASAMRRRIHDDSVPASPTRSPRRWMMAIAGCRAMS